MPGVGRLLPGIQGEHGGVVAGERVRNVNALPGGLGSRDHRNTVG
jgi:hypothetical protein